MKLNPPAHKLWRSLGELAGTVDIKNRQNEFLANIGDPKNFDRRAFLKIMGAGLALSGIPACTRQPIEKIVPYVNQPEQLVPGKPLHFATAMNWNGFATGLLAESYEGHPVKIEGNPQHPASLGATNVFHQAALLDLYDPNRSKHILNHGQPSHWNDCLAALRQALQDQTGEIRILTETIVSPTLHSQIQACLKKFPKAKWHQYEPVNRDNVKEGARLTFGEIVETQHHFDKARVILSLDSDFLYTHPNSLRYAREFAANRKAREPQNEMNRLYSAESGVSITGANADHRLPLQWAQIQIFALALASRLQAIPSAAELPASPDEKWISAVTQDLSQHHGECLVIAGDNQPPHVHMLAHLLNHKLENVGTTVTYTNSAEANPISQLESLTELNEALAKGEVNTLIILGGNPVFTAPVDFNFGESLARAKFKVHLNANVNETSRLCDWHIPENHFLESWSDTRAFDGTISIIQPLILPLYEGRSAHELLDAIAGVPARSDYDIVHEYWRANNPGKEFEMDWRRTLRDGLIQSSALPARNISPRQFEVTLPKATGDTLEITFRPDPTLWDGRFANNAWLQELPKPITKLVWDSAALISPALANREKLSNGDIIEITARNRKIETPVWITPGQPENTIALQFGYGQTYALRASDSPWSVSNARITKTNRTYNLVTTQDQHVIDSEDRQILREGTFDEFKTNPDFVHQNSESPSETLFNPAEFKYDGYRWAMSIDLSACIGCNACVLACQAENNIPTVGKKEVARGRIMQWIRVDNYFRGNPNNPEFTHQPVPCMHCENAPCELVCPVGATIHDKEGLNLQVYNRCVGTRYCSNNCPYKVRRFNFFQYADYKTPSFKPMRNPNVTVRWRGVMEKCTYCIQRISAARINSEEQGRKISDGEIRTACQQVCPAQAIVFGDLSNPHSAVSKIKSHPLNFLMLGQLNTRPRTTYLARLKNPNPALSS
ncbi:MAG TPA: TAT-variant-translocated molybdopterin oxidoreductase [Verrucomicrobiae bacterium]